MDRETLHQLYIVEGWNMADIGRKLGRSKSLVSYWIDRYGLREKDPSASPIDVEHLRRMYVDERLGDKDIASRLGRPVKLIQRIRHAYGIFREDRASEIIKRYQAGESMYQLAEHFNLDRNTIRKKLLASGVALRDKATAIRLAAARKGGRRIR